MLGYNRLGINGRLGNQMFQYAALRGIASKHNYDWVIPPLDHTTIPMAEYVLFDGFKMTNVKESNFGFIPQDRPTYDEPSHDFDVNLFNNCPDNINLDGFRQSEKYFKHIEDEIREDFTFKEDIYEPCKEFISQYGDDIIFLHVRRSDSTGRTEYFPIADIGWFEEMLEYFPKDVPVLILTDKLDWVKSQKLFDNDRFLLSEDREYSDNLVWNGRGKMEYTLSPWIDLCLMGDVAKGIKSFKKGMASDVTDESETKNISDDNQDSNNSNNQNSNNSSSSTGESSERLISSAVGYILGIEKRNNRFDPTEGFFAEISETYSGVGGDVNFLKSRLRGAYYKPVSFDRFVLGARSEIGHINGLGENVTQSNRFLLGGNKVRGFDGAGIGPRDNTSEGAVGGNNYYAGSFEVISGVGFNPDLGMRWTLFADYGSAWGTDFPTGVVGAEDDSMRQSVGFGLLWDTAIGPLSFYWAEPIAKQTYDKLREFQFTIGTRL